VAASRRRGRVVGPERRALVELLAARVPRTVRPSLVALDGGDGAGKTVLADELAALVGGSVRAILDDFHHPRAHRHALGRTGRSVWERGFDYTAVRRELLDPWRRGPGSAYRRRWHDLTTDAYVDDLTDVVPESGVLIVDGVFAQRPELAGSWDLVVYVDMPDDVRVCRMAARDGLSPEPDHPEQQRYLDAQRLYRDACRPRESADIVVDNTDLERPILTLA
jgi:uridine kinase